MSYYLIRSLFYHTRWYLETIESILRQSNSVINRRIFVDDTLLHFVLKNDQCSPAVVNVLLRYGANVSIKDGQDMTPLEIAIRYQRDEESLLALVARGALATEHNPYPPYFCLAVIHNAPMSVIDEIIKSRRGLEQCEITCHQKCMLDFAVSCPHSGKTLKIIKKLMEAGFSLKPNLLHIALKCVNNLETIDFLIENNVEFETIKLMLDSIEDADLNSFTDVFGNSLLHKAVQDKTCLLNLVELLIMRGINVNHVNKLGDTALDEAVLNSDCPENVLIILLKNGSNLLPRSVSLARSDTKLLKLLLATGISLGKERHLRELEHAAICIDSYPKLIIYFQYLLRYYLLEYSDFDLPFLRSDHTHYNNIVRYKDRCVWEVTRLKSRKVGLNYTASDLLGKNSSLRGAATNMEDKIPDFNRLLKAISGCSFRLYRYIIVDKVTRPVLEKNIYQTKVYVSKIFDRKRIDIVLNNDCLRIILQNLEDLDLFNLSSAFFKRDPSVFSTEDSPRKKNASSAEEPLKRFKLDE